MARASPVGDILPVVSDIPLDVDDDRFDVKSALIPVAAKWKDIGTALRLKAGDLDAIEAAHPGNPQACLSEGVTHWLRRNYNSKRFGPPTWRKLVEVVADPAAGGNPALAREIALEHCSKFNRMIVPLPNTSQVTPIPLRRQKWYHRITRIAAERKLQDTPDGCFLVRESESREGSYALSLNHLRMVKHFCIRRKASGQYELDGMEKSFDNLPALVDYYSHWSISTEGELLRVPFAADSLPDAQTITEKRPESHQLNPLKYMDDHGKVQRIRILDEIGTRWYDVGWNLRIGDEHLENIGERERHDPTSCARAMVIKWLQSGQDPTWVKLIEALEDSELTTLVEKLKMALPRMKMD